VAAEIPAATGLLVKHVSLCQSSIGEPFLLAFRENEKTDYCSGSDPGYD